MRILSIMIKQDISFYNRFSSMGHEKLNDDVKVDGGAIKVNVKGDVKGDGGAICLIQDDVKISQMDALYSLEWVMRN